MELLQSCYQACFLPKRRNFLTRQRSNDMRLQNTIEHPIFGSSGCLFLLGMFLGFAAALLIDDETDVNLAAFVFEDSRWVSQKNRRVQFDRVYVGCRKEPFFFPPDTYQLMVNWWFGARWFGHLGFPSERETVAEGHPEQKSKFTPILPFLLRSSLRWEEKPHST